MGGKLRLVKVDVQPHFIIDDGENIEEVPHSAVTIPASEWPSYSNERFPREVKIWQEKIDKDSSDADS